jgi:hypothetical protein
VGDTDQDGLLDPGEEWKYSSERDTGTLVPGQDVNIADVSGMPVNQQGEPIGAPVTDTDPACWKLTGDTAPIGAVGDYIWRDEDGDGRQDGGESGIFDVRVVLRTCAGEFVSATRTDSQGMYLFEGLSAGCYEVDVEEGTLPSGAEPTLTDAAGDAEDSDGAADGGAVTVYLSTDSSVDLTIDFGYVFDEQEAPGTGTPGYWKNHPDAWPVEEITIGGVTYTRSQAIGIMRRPERGDKTYTMFRALVAAKLNVAAGNESSCIEDTIEAADEWMAEHGPAGSGVRGGGRRSPWRDGEPLYERLDDYNNGRLCAPSRD